MRCADCVFNELESGSTEGVVHIQGSVAFFQSCDFRDIYTSTRTLQGFHLAGGPFFVEFPNSTLALSNCTLRNITSTAHVWISHAAQVYCNDDNLQVRPSLALALFCTFPQGMAGQ